jgi:hypothetical protein
MRSLKKKVNHQRSEEGRGIEYSLENAKEQQLRAPRYICHVFPCA